MSVVPSHSPTMTFALVRHTAGSDARLSAAVLQSIAANLELQRVDLPARPLRLRRVLEAFALGEPVPDRTGPVDLIGALAELRRAVFDGSGTAAAGASAWSEAVATGWIAAELARRMNCSPGAMGVAGLLHGSGTCLARRALVAAERETGMTLDPATRSQFCSDAEPTLIDALVRRWRLTAPAALALRGWRRSGESERCSAEARCVYAAHALAAAQLHDGFPVPGLGAALVALLGLRPKEIDGLRDQSVRVIDRVRRLA